MHVRLVMLAVLAVLAACGPPPPPYGTPASSGPVTMRAPKNAPPDPVGTSLPGTRSCNDTTDCKPSEACFAPDGKLAEPTSPAPCTHDCPAAPPSCAEPNAPICPQ